MNKIKHLYGLIGYPLSHSFSKKYFADKFEREKIEGCFYELFPIEKIEDLPELIEGLPKLCGLNVTIPYKQVVMPYLDALDEAAEAVGAVNTIKIENGRLKGYNTDIFGFEKSLLDFLQKESEETIAALILGTGGAARAVAYVLDKNDIPYSLVSRTLSGKNLNYGTLDEKIIKNHRLIINTTPLGMAPGIGKFPSIPYDYIGNDHYIYDLIYNPSETLFMQKAKAAGAKVMNGLKMLELQAEKAWEIWNYEKNW